MSQAASQPEDLETGNVGGDDYSEQPRLVPNLAAQSEFLPDRSGPLFSMYSRMGERADDKVVELWRKDADGILIFAGLFSTVVATFLAVSLPDLKSNSQGPSEFYLEQIYNRLGETDRSRASFPNIAAKPPIFSPPTYAVWVNTLWFLSFAISLTYGMLAVMLYQWAGRYKRVTQQLRSTPHRRARVRALFSDAIDGLHVLWVIEGARAMVHLSMFIFFAGLLIYLFNICGTAFAVVVSWMALSTVVYASFTLLPIFRPNSPYYAPLSSMLWSLYACICYAVFKVLSSTAFNFLGSIAIDRFRGLRDYYRERFFDDMRKIAEESASQRLSEIDAHVLESTFDAVGEDGTWETFFEAIPGFFGSETVDVLQEHLSDAFRTKFSRALNGFLDHTLSLSSVTESFRSDRLVMCLNAANATLGFDGVSHILLDIRNRRWPELLQSVEMGHSLRRWRDSNGKQFASDIGRIVAQIIVDARERDNRWISLVNTEYGIAEHILRNYIGNGDSVLLCVLTRMTRQVFHTGSWTPWILLSLSEFSIHDTLPELRHAFCALWNDIVREAWNEQGPINVPMLILRDIRHAYIALHQNTDAALTTFSASTYHFHPVLRQPWSYRLCNIASHRQGSTIDTPATGSLIMSSFTRSSAISSHPSPTIENDHTSDGRITPQRTEEAKSIVDQTSSTDLSPHPNHTQEFTFTSIAASSVRESTGTVVTRDPNLLVPGEAPHNPCQEPSPSTAEVAAVLTVVRPDDPTPQLRISEVSAETPLASAHPDSVLTPTPLSSRPSSSFVPDPGDDLDTLQPSTLAAILSRAPQNIEQQDATVPCTSLDTNEIPSADNPIPWSIPTAPPIVVSDFLSSRILHPVHSCGMTTERPSSYLEFAPTQPDLDSPRSLSRSLTTSSSPFPPQVTSISFTQASTSIGPHDDTGDPNAPIPMTALPHSIQTAMPAHDVVSNALPLEGQVQRDPDKSS